MKKEQQQLLIGLGVVALIGLGAYLLLGDKVETNGPSDSDAVEETPYSGAPAVSFDFIMPEEWEFYNNAIKDIQALTPDQTMPFGVVQSKNDSFVYYFATTAPDPADSTSTLHSVYYYNNTYHFERLYRLSLDSNETLPGIRPGIEVALHPIGHDGYNLVILAQDADSSPGPCTEVLTLGRDTTSQIYYSMFSLNILDPYAKGLEPYRVPDDVYEAALERQDACVRAF